MTTDHELAIQSTAAVPPATPSIPEQYGFAPLTPEEARVLGALVEKQLTTPDYYPLTLNSLVAACNQKNNRSPLVEYDEKIVVRALDHLREKKLGFLVMLAGGRVPKYEHRLGEKLHLAKKEELALLCELLLRGPQTVGELRTRAERMTPFASLEATQAAVDALAARPVPLVTVLPRLPGHKEPRHMHLLGDPPDLAALAAAPAAVEPVRARLQAEEARLATVEQELQAVKAALAELQADFARFKAQF